jgi:DNA-binding PadR family transcriptional regulator
MFQIRPGRFGYIHSIDEGATMSKSEKGRNIWIPKDLIQSKAYQSLRTPAAYRVLALFWIRRQFCKFKHGSKRGQWNLANNGEIVFTYLEAQKHWHLTEGTFRRALDELREKGFLDITESGQGVYKVTNLYALSDRWRKYGTAEYEPPKPRKKGPINRGFQKGNQYGRNYQEEKLTVTDNNGSTVIDNNKPAARQESYVHGQT